jgi:hypothetical protein
MAYQKTANNIYIADGSKSQHDLSNYSSLLKLRYKYFGDDNTVKLFIKKIIQALQDINTKYVMMCSNDDFPIDNTIKKLLNEIKKYKGAQCGKGPSLWINLLHTDQVNGEIINLRDFQKNYKIINRLPIERIRSLSKEYTSSWHSIIKKDLLQKIMKYIYNKKIFDIYILENFLSIVVVLSSKILESKEHLIIHQDHLDRLSLDKKLLRNNIYSIYKNKKFLKYVEDFCKLNHININIKDFEKEINNIFFKHCLEKNKIESNKNSVNKFKKFILKISDKTVFFDFYTKTKYYFSRNAVKQLILKKSKIDKFLKIRREGNLIN